MDLLSLILSLLLGLRSGNGTPIPPEGEADPQSGNGTPIPPG